MGDGGLVDFAASEHRLKVEKLVHQFIDKLEDESQEKHEPKRNSKLGQRFVQMFDNRSQELDRVDGFTVG